MRYEAIPKTIRHACMLDGKELEAMPNKHGFSSYVLPEGEPNFNRTSIVAVLKEDGEHNPIWWLEDGGINWMTFGACSEEYARALYGRLTGEVDTNRIMVEKAGTCSFSLHR